MGTCAFRTMKPVLVFLMLACASVGPHAQQLAAPDASHYSANIAIDWFQLDLQLVQQTPGFSPPVAARALGYLGLALYESNSTRCPGPSPTKRCTGPPWPTPRWRR
jgi:hypothetical protein